jgi:hypothetical protein
VDLEPQGQDMSRGKRTAIGCLLSLAMITLAMISLEMTWPVLTVSWAADTADSQFSKGLSAFNEGDYSAALSAWEPLAALNDPRAEAGLGFMYHRGLGVPVDGAKAVLYLQKAAEQGQPEGQLMLGTLYYYGRGVPQSYIHAFAWCEMAQDSGQSDAFLCRDAAIQSLSDEDLQEGNRMVAELRARINHR